MQIQRIWLYFRKGMKPGIPENYLVYGSLRKTKIILELQKNGLTGLTGFKNIAVPG